MKDRKTLLFLVLFLVPFAMASQNHTPAARRSADVKTNTQKNETEIREVYSRWAKAFGAHDVDAIMSFYAPGDAVVAYDIVPPLQYVSADAYRKDYAEFLSGYDGPIDVEFRDLRVVAGDNVAFIHSLERVTGTLKNGQKSDIWLRATSGLRKINGKWLIVHDHISVPADFESGKALLNLKP